MIKGKGSEPLGHYADTYKLREEKGEEAGKIGRASDYSATLRKY